MRPRERRESGEQDLFRSRLDQIIDIKHALVRLARTIDWRFLEQTFGAVYTDKPGQPPLPTRLMAGLAILKMLRVLIRHAIDIGWLKHDPSFGIIVSEKARSPKAGNPLEVVGSYNPKTKHTIIDDAAVKGWLAKGAKASGTVHNLLITKGVITGKKVNVLQKRNIKKEGEEAKADASAVPAEAAKAEAAKAEAWYRP